MKKYKITNQKYGEVGEQITFASLEKVADEQGLDRPLRVETRNDDLEVVVDSYGVVVAEIEPEPEEEKSSSEADTDADEPAKKSTKKK